MSSTLPECPIKKAIATVGYDEAAFRKGRTILDAFEQAVQNRQTEYGEQFGATDTLNDAWG